MHNTIQKFTNGVRSLATFVCNTLRLVYPSSFAMRKELRDAISC